MTGLDKIEPPRCVNTGAVKAIFCAGRDEDDDTVDPVCRQDAQVRRPTTHRTSYDQ